MSIIAAKNLAVGYGGRAVAENINFELEQGSFLCIVGENGSGKSTLMKTILGLQQPLGGTISTRGGLRKNNIGYLPQQTDMQKDFPASVREVVLSGFQGKCGWRPLYNSKEKELAHANMNRMGISELGGKCYRNLSGGQQQRVLLARALCAADRMLLLDEPVSGLDPVVTREMYGLIQKLNSDGLTIIMISHDIEAALRYASHILHIGNEVFFGSRDEYIRSRAGENFLEARGGEQL